MFDQLQTLGLGIVVFAVVIGVGVIITQNFAQSVAGCGTGTPTGSNFVWNATSETCMNSTGSSATNPAGTTNLLYLGTQLGTSGLAGWTPAVIALAVGLLFIGAFLYGKGGKKGRY